MLDFERESGFVLKTQHRIEDIIADCYTDKNRVCVYTVYSPCVWHDTNRLHPLAWCLLTGGQGRGMADGI
jgi:hypothetical protein